MPGRTSETSGWNPAIYERFKAERRRPFVDLLTSLGDLSPGGRILDLGCGDGRLTGEVHRKFAARSTLGVDSSAEMLAAARRTDTAGVTFARGEAETISFPAGRFDLIFSNSLLHWVPHHEKVLRKFRAWTRQGGALAVQFPVNAGHPGHTAAAEVAASAEFRERLGGYVHRQYSLPLAAYGELLLHLGYRDVRTFCQVYTHPLEHAADVVAFAEGALLTGYRSRLSEREYGRFLERYRARFLQSTPVRSPYFYTYRRNFIVAKRFATL